MGVVRALIDSFCNVQGKRRQGKMVGDKSLVTEEEDLFICRKPR